MEFNINSKPTANLKVCLQKNQEIYLYCVKYTKLDFYCDCYEGGGGYEKIGNPLIKFKWCTHRTIFLKRVIIITSI